MSAFLLLAFAADFGGESWTALDFRGSTFRGGASSSFACGSNTFAVLVAATIGFFGGSGSIGFSGSNSGRLIGWEMGTGAKAAGNDLGGKGGFIAFTFTFRDISIVMVSSFVSADSPSPPRPVMSDIAAASTIQCNPIEITGGSHSLLPRRRFIILRANQNIMRSADNCNLGFIEAIKPGQAGQNP